MELFLIGNPNVGKSVVFNRLTGIGTISSNYPGTTVEYLRAEVVMKGKRINVTDLPGIYSLTPGTEDQLVAAKLLSGARPDCILVVADATRLEPSLVLTFQLIELGFPVLMALNMMDAARKRGDLDVEALSKKLGVPIVPTVATTGEGIGELMDAIIGYQYVPSEFRVRYDSHIEAYMQVMKQGIGDSQLKYSPRGASIKLLEGDEQFTSGFPKDMPDQVKRLRGEFRAEHAEDLEVHITRDRYGEAGKMITEVLRPNPQQRTPKQRLSDLTMRPLTGLPILGLVMVGVFATIIFVGAWLEATLLGLWADVSGSFFTDMSHAIGGEVGFAIANGLDLSIQSILAIVIPYILLFYLILGVLEDSGYLPRVVVLLDRIMHKIGLHGQAVIPMLVGVGCNVPAILATRMIESRREKLILATIIVMAVPCSAQMAVIIGTIGRYGGIIYVMVILLILLGLILVLGRLLHKVLKFEPSSLMMEIPDLTVPSAKNVGKKTWMRVKEFFVIAFPILLVGSIALEVLSAYGVLETLVDPLSFFTVGLLGLPAIIIIALIFGLLRKEMSFQLLVVLFGTADLASVMTLDQLFVFALVMATFMPCLSALTVMIREYGLKDSLKVTFASMALAFTLGGVANLVLSVI
ncbi:MAG: ferrous iron transport protein B [Methanomassiliicoccales archaeon]|nr:ferrous iron transport protein B [Methanomassiliicoccales archaeon]